MNVKIRKGDLFNVDAEALVNTVNCVGVMGKGVALEFKKRWPENFRAYKKLCDRGELEPGRLFVYVLPTLLSEETPKYVVNFPTKVHWRSKSKLQYVESGLDALIDELRRLKIKSIAMPPLGCGNGGLSWDQVKPLIVQKLSSVPEVSVVLFPPNQINDEPEHARSTFDLTAERALLIKALGELEFHFDGGFDRISLQKIVYFLQAFGVKFNIEFSRNLHGPYSETLRKAFIGLEKAGLLSGFTTGDRRAHATAAGFAAADEFLSGQENKVVDHLDRLIEGFESPYGLELLSSVHWLVVHEKQSSVSEVISGMRRWSEDKRNLYDDNAIKFAYDRLLADGLITNSV